jgi:hypothetical protein
MKNSSLLIEYAISTAEMESGLPLAIVSRRSGLPLACLTKPGNPGKHPRWTEEEDEYLRSHLGFLEETQIAEHLGRSQMAIHLRWSRDLHLPAPSKHPDYLTAQQIAKRLGEDAHKVCSWIDRGLLPGEIMPGGRKIRRVRKIVLLRWLLNPANQIWFDINRARDSKYRRLLELKRERWGDEWWTTRQVADYHHVDVGDVKRYIKLGRIKAVQARNLGGRDNGYWAFWFVLRSEATRPDLIFYRGIGSGHELKTWTERSDAFLLLARAVGLPTRNIAALVHWDYKRVDFRLRSLHRRGRIAGIIARQRLDIAYRPTDGSLFADWRLYRRRFPFLVKAMDEFETYLRTGASSYPISFLPGQTHSGLLVVRSVLHTWIAWHAQEDSRRDLAFRLCFSVHARPKTLADAWQTLQNMLGGAA